MPVTSTCFTLPSSTLALNCVRLNSASFWPELAVLTNCQSTTAEPAMTNQKTIVFIVEFTEKNPPSGFPSGKPKASPQLDAEPGISIDKMPLRYSTPPGEEKLPDCGRT